WMSPTRALQSGVLLPKSKAEASANPAPRRCSSSIIRDSLSPAESRRPRPLRPPHVAEGCPPADAHGSDQWLVPSFIQTCPVTLLFLSYRKYRLTIARREYTFQRHEDRRSSSAPGSSR